MIKQSKLAIALVLLASFCFCAFAEAQNVAINSTNFPDKAFRKGIQNSEYRYDRNGDGIISVSEQKDFKDIEIYNGGIKSAKGIELFPHLTGLTLPNNKLEKLDLVGNRKLIYIDVQNNRLESLNVSCCPKLEWLDVQNNRLINLTLTNTPELEILIVRNNKLVQLDLTGHKKLRQLSCEDNNIKWLEIDNCTKLIDTVKKKMPYRSGSVVSWDGYLTIDKNTVVTIDGTACYLPEMFPFLADADNVLGYEAFDDTGLEAPWPAIVKKEAKVYSDRRKKHSAGTIPAYTAVIASKVKGSSVYEITGYGSMTCYVESSALWCPKSPNPKWTYKKLSKSTKGYQRPDFSSASKTLKSKTSIAVISEKDGWYLIRAAGDYDSYFYIPMQ